MPGNGDPETVRCLTLGELAKVEELRERGVLVCGCFLTVAYMGVLEETEGRELSQLGGRE